MEIINKRSKIVGSYIGGGAGFLSRENTFHYRRKAEFEFLSTTYVCSSSGETRVTFTEPFNLKNNFQTRDVYEDKFRSDCFVKSNLLDCEGLELTMDGGFTVINLTNFPIVMTNDRNMRKIFSPLECEHLSQYIGKIIILDTAYLNGPKWINDNREYRKGESLSDINDYESYFDEMICRIERDERKNGIDLNTKKTLEIYKEGDELMKLIHKNIPNVRYRSIKVMSALVLDAGDFENLKLNQEYLISEYNLMLSRLEPSRTMNNPVGMRTISEMSELFSDASGTRFTMFINDPANKLTQRYINLCGKAILVPCFSTNLAEEGFHFYSDETNDEKIYLTLEEIKECNYLFKSEEEALDNLSLESKLRLEKLRTDYNTSEAKRVTAVTQKETAEHTHSQTKEEMKHEKTEREFEKEESKDKRKHEWVKTLTDSVVGVLKAITAVGVAIFTLYRAIRN